MLAVLLQRDNLLRVVIVLLGDLGELFLQLGLAVFRSVLVKSVLLFYSFLALVELGSVCPELVPLLDDFALLLAHLFHLIGQLGVGLSQQLNLSIHLVT